MDNRSKSKVEALSPDGTRMRILNIRNPQTGTHIFTDTPEDAVDSAAVGLRNSVVRGTGDGPSTVMKNRMTVQDADNKPRPKPKTLSFGTEKMEVFCGNPFKMKTGVSYTGSYGFTSDTGILVFSLETDELVRTLIYEISRYYTYMYLLNV
jgi:hypothetical protein